MRRLVTALAVAVVLVAPACGKDAKPGESSSAASSTAASSSSASSSPAQPAGLNIDIRVSGGNVTPTNAEWQAKVGEPITLHVTSDAVDQLHVHSVPEHEFVVTDVGNQEFQFIVDVPGSVEVELHKLNRTVGTIHVQP